MNEIRDIHKPFLSWLHKNKLLYVYHRPDTRSGIATGWPDFTICHCGKCLLIEAKTPKGKVTPIQHMMHLDLRANGNTVVIAYSAAAAISAVQTWLGVEKPEIQPPGRSECPLDNERAAELIAAETAPLWIANILGVDQVLYGDPLPGGLARILRRATPQDIRDLPRK